MNQPKERKSFLRPSMLFGIVIVILFISVYFYSDIEFDLTEDTSNVTEIHYVDGITSAHLKLIEIFNEKYKGRIKVIPINLPFDKFSTNERKELLARSLRSKSEKIDLFAVDIVWGYRFAKWAENLTPYFNEEDIDKVVDTVLPTCFYNDSLIAFPFKIDLSTMYYRDDLIADLPDYEQLKAKLNNSITWEDLIDLGIRVKNKVDPIYLFPASDYEGLICSFMELVMNQDRDFFNVVNIDLTRPEAVKAMTTLRDLIYKYEFTPKVVTAFTEHPCHQYFIKHKGLFVRSWPTFFSESYGNLTEEIKSKIKRVPLPHYKNTTPAAVYGGWNLMISKFSENKPEVLEFIKFLLQPESQKILFEMNGSLPVLKSVYKDPSVKNADALRFYHEQFEYGVHRPLLEDYTRISDIISYFVHKVLTDDLEINAALHKATNMINSNVVIFK